MIEPDLQADCASCAALCCVAFYFDKGDEFAIDKPAATPCPKLDRHSCTIHDRLEDEGFAGCRRYDCHGAGQRVVQDLFGGRSWQDDPKLMRPMIDAFAAMRALHDRRVLLAAAARLPLSPGDEAQRARLAHDLSPRGFDTEGLAAFPASPQAAAIDAFIAGLRRYIPAPGH
ncbi:hypothetical protein [Pseudooceanicola pacificus]|uniref:hypothetical protein n=1 Tax=Pseudooceanicola pacificus TaxID=2676438 RepID=UPI002E26A5B9